MQTRNRWDEIHTRADVPSHAIRIHDATAGVDRAGLITDLASDEPAELEQLRWARWVMAEAAQLQEAAVIEARRAGASWDTVGAIFGASRQAAWERFRHLDPQ